MDTGGNSNGANNGMSGGGGMGGGMQSFMRSARRRAIAQTMRPHKVAHGLLHAPTIAHSQNGTGTKPPAMNFSPGASFKPTGF